MIEFDLYVKRSDGKWSCRGSFSTKEMAMKIKNKKYKTDEYFIKESEKKRSRYE